MRADPSFLTLSLDSFFACLFIGGLEGLLFGLIPLRFLPGARIANWSWIAWGVLTAVVAYLFVHVLLMPETGYLGRSTAASVTTTIVLFAAFAVVSVLFWGYFRLRPTPEEPTEERSAEAPLESGEDLVVPEEKQPAPARVPVDSQGDVDPRQHTAGATPTGTRRGPAVRQVRPVRRESPS